MAMSILSYIHAHFDVKLPVDKFFLINLRYEKLQEVSIL